MKTIHTLIPDIYSLVGGEHGITDLTASNVGSNIAGALQQSFGPREHRGLRLSGLRPKCPRHLWYEVHHPELAEPLPPYAKIKYAYGHIIEHLIIGLAKQSGHLVVGEQDELIVDGIVGHRDCVIDGAIVDVKSASSLNFAKFKDKTIAENDGFGYLDQLDAYMVGSADDPLVTVKDRAYLLAVDKTLGHLCLYEHRLREKSIRQRIKQYKHVVGLPSPPSCECKTVADGESGNIKLDVQASYSPYKHICFPGLRTFLYEGGPRYLVNVSKRPMRRDRKTPIPEIDNHGNFIYNGYS